MRTLAKVGLALGLVVGLAWGEVTVWAQFPFGSGRCSSQRIKRVPTDCRTIQEAVDRARSGDRILIRPNTYRENVVVRNKRRLTIESDNGRDSRPVIVEGKSAGRAPIFKIEGSRDIEFKNAFVFRRGTVGLELINSQNIELNHQQGRRLVLTQNAGSGLVMSGGRLTGQWVAIEDNGKFGVFADATSVASGQGNTISGNNPDLSENLSL